MGCAEASGVPANDGPVVELHGFEVHRESQKTLFFGEVPGSAVSKFARSMERTSENPFLGALQRLMAAVHEQNVQIIENQATLSAKLYQTLENQSLMAAGLNLVSEHLRETNPGFQGFVIDLQAEGASYEPPSRDSTGTSGRGFGDGRRATPDADRDLTGRHSCESDVQSYAPRARGSRRADFDPVDRGDDSGGRSLYGRYDADCESRRPAASQSQQSGHPRRDGKSSYHYESSRRGDGVPRRRL